jgi:hypothetical protein
MRVTEKDDQLILRTSWSGLFTPILFGLIAMLIAGNVFWTTGRETTLNCRRLEVDQVQCQLQQIFLSRVVSQTTVDNPQQAIVQTSHSSKGGTSYRMALFTAKGTIPLTDFYSSDTDADDLAAQFNQFAHNSAAKSVFLDQPASGFIFIFLVIFIGFGLMMILTTHYDTSVFDRNRDTVTFARLGFTGAHTREESINGLTADVRQFRGSKGRRYYCVFLRLTGGAPVIKLDWNASNESKAQDLADRIQEFVKPGVHIKYANI